VRPWVWGRDVSRSHAAWMTWYGAADGADRAARGGGAAPAAARVVLEVPKVGRRHGNCDTKQSERNETQQNDQNKGIEAKRKRVEAKRSDQSGAKDCAFHLTWQPPFACGWSI
jgi:hypothetical protein